MSDHPINAASTHSLSSNAPDDPPRGVWSSMHYDHDQLAQQNPPKHQKYHQYPQATQVPALGLASHNSAESAGDDPSGYSLTERDHQNMARQHKTNGTGSVTFPALTPFPASAPHSSSYTPAKRSFDVLHQDYDHTEGPPLKKGGLASFLGTNTGKEPSSGESRLSLEAVKHGVGKLDLSTVDFKGINKSPDMGDLPKSGQADTTPGYAKCLQNTRQLAECLSVEEQNASSDSSASVDLVDVLYTSEDDMFIHPQHSEPYAALPAPPPTTATENGSRKNNNGSGMPKFAYNAGPASSDSNFSRVADRILAPTPPDILACLPRDKDGVPRAPEPEEWTEQRVEVIWLLNCLERRANQEWEGGAEVAQYDLDLSLKAHIGAYAI